MSPEYMQALMANASAPTSNKGRAVMKGGQLTLPSTSPKKKNFLLDQISTVTGIAGGIGGGILGGIGGLGVGAVPGAAAGGAGGSALGELIENAITKDSLSKNLLKEGIIGGITAGGPIKLAKVGLQAGGKALGKKAAEEVAEKTVRTAAERGSQGLLSGAWGVKTGMKVGASKPLTPQTARGLQRFIAKEVGVGKTANADMAAERLVNFKSLMGRNIDDIVSTSDRNLSKLEISNLAESISGKVNKLALVNKNNPTIAQLSEELGSNRSLSDLVKYRRSLDDTINFARNEASPDPITERIAVAARDEIDKFTSKLIPGLKSANTSYSQASKALDYVLPAAKNPKGLSIGNNKIGGSIYQRVQAAAGQAKLGTGSLMKKAPTTSPLGITARMGGVAALRGGEQPQDLESALMDSQSSLGMNPMTNSMNMPSNIQPNIMDEEYSNSGDLSSDNPFAPENIQTNIRTIMQNGGTTKDVKEYLELATIISKLTETPESKVKPLTGESRNRALKAESGLRSLETLEDTLTRNPGAFKTASLPNPMGITGRLTGTSDVRAATDNLVDIIARMRSGAAITDDEAKRFARLLPQAGDSPASASRKLSIVRAELESYLDPVEESASLEDVLMQYQ